MTAEVLRGGNTGQGIQERRHRVTRDKGTGWHWVLHGYKQLWSLVQTGSRTKLLLGVAKMTKKSFLTYAKDTIYRNLDVRMHGQMR